MMPRMWTKSCVHAHYSKLPDTDDDVGDPMPPVRRAGLLRAFSRGWILVAFPWFLVMGMLLLFIQTEKLELSFPRPGGAPANCACVDDGYATEIRKCRSSLLTVVEFSLSKNHSIREEANSTPRLVFHRWFSI